MGSASGSVVAGSWRLQCSPCSRISQHPYPDPLSPPRQEGAGLRDRLVWEGRTMRRMRLDWRLWRQTRTGPVPERGWERSAGLMSLSRRRRGYPPRQGGGTWWNTCRSHRGPSSTGCWWLPTGSCWLSNLSWMHLLHKTSISERFCCLIEEHANTPWQLHYIYIYIYIVENFNKCNLYISQISQITLNKILGLCLGECTTSISCKLSREEPHKHSKINVCARTM